MLHILFLFRNYSHFHIFTYTYVMWGKKIKKHSVTIFVQICIMLNIFPSACYFFFQFSKKTTLTWKNFYQANLENYINKILAWSESQLKLSSLVSWCADFTRFVQFRSWITGVLAFLKKSQRIWTSVVLGKLRQRLSIG